MAAAALAGVAAAFLSLHAGAAALRPSHHGTALTHAGLTAEVTAAVVHDVTAAKVGQARQDAQRRHLAHLRAVARRRAAQLRAQQAQQAAAQPPPSPAPPSSGVDAAHSPLGICIRNAEEGGSYAWGPGNGGGAYQFSLGTWEAYGGAASQFGVAGPAYQDQIFDNAIAAGGASNWTNYDGC